MSYAMIEHRDYQPLIRAIIKNRLNNLIWTANLNQNKKSNTKGISSNMSITATNTFKHLIL